MTHLSPFIAHLVLQKQEQLVLLFTPVCKGVIAAQHESERSELITQRVSMRRCAHQVHGQILWCLVNNMQGARRVIARVRVPTLLTD